MGKLRRGTASAGVCQDRALSAGSGEHDEHEPRSGSWWTSAMDLAQARRRTTTETKNSKLSSSTIAAAAATSR